jgi:hypothetical protein
VSTNKSFIVPRNNNSHLLYPLSEPADGLLSYNLGLQVDSPRWLQDLRVLARIEALEEAQNFDNWCGYLDTSTSRKTTATKPKRWLVGGHQPELFHPGVWFKNYLLAGISQKLSANGSACQPLHVIIDHDLAKADTIKTIYEKAGKLVVRNNVLPFRSLAHPPLPWQSTYLEPSMLPDWQDVVNSVEQDCISQGWEPILSTRFSVLERCISTNKSVGDAFSLLRRSVLLLENLFFDALVNRPDSWMHTTLAETSFAVDAKYETRPNRFLNFNRKPVGLRCRFGFIVPGVQNQRF